MPKEMKQSEKDYIYAAIEIYKKSAWYSPDGYNEGLARVIEVAIKSYNRLKAR
jgi:hypothetical protein